MNGQIVTIARGVILSLLVIIPAGCSDKLDNCQVTGTVKYQDRPVSGGQVSLFSPALGVGATAPLGPEGAFKIEGSMRPGNYIVTIKPPAAPPPVTSGATPANKQTASYVPEKYRNDQKSDLKVDITSGSNRLDLVLNP